MPRLAAKDHAFNGSAVPAVASPASVVPTFDFSFHLRRVCVDMCDRVPELRHIRMDCVAVAMRRARKRVSHGLQASLTPLRFAGGQLVTENRRGRWTIQRLFDAPGGREFLYILNFYVPRFLDHTFEEKLLTIVHELWHIGPACDGDLRRHEGRCYMHSGRQSHYDAWAARLSQDWLAARPPPEIFDFLRLSSGELLARHSGIAGTRIPTPRLIRV